MISSHDPNNLLCQAARYVLVRNLAASSAYQLCRTVALFGEWLNREPTIFDLSGDVVSTWLEKIGETRSTRTVCGHRVNLLALWRFLAEEGVVQAPRQVRRVAKPDPCPVAWTLEEIRALLDQASKATGIMDDGTPYAIYWECTVRAAWDSGLRRSDLWRLTLDVIRPDGTLQLRQQIGRAHV